MNDTDIPVTDRRHPQWRQGHISSQAGRERATLPVEPGLRGSRVRFSFSVPADRPATTKRSDNCIQWVVHLHRKLPGADLDQAFELPVRYRHAAAVTAHTRTLYAVR